MNRSRPTGSPDGLDRGLTEAVDRFVDGVGEALRTAALGTSVDADRLRRDATVEAFNLATACVDADARRTDDELWALIAAFSRHQLIPAAATPANLRDGSLVDGRHSWLTEPSALFRTLADVDRSRGTDFARRYYDEAMALAHMVASLDRYPSHDELAAIVAFQRLLLASLPAKPTATPAGGTVPGASAKAPAAPEPMRQEDPPEPLENLLAELEGLIGLAAVKEEVRLLSALLRVQKLRQARGLPVVDSTKHLVFSGNPGTGKTTVARLLAGIYRTLGVVERGHLTEVDRAGLVAGFVGQTATKVGEVFEAADGGVLLIDEAYSLIRGGEKDFSREAIDAIVKQVEDRRDSLVVILADYPKEMAELVSANPGFRSRFPKTILFPDYTDTELLQILRLTTRKSGYELTPEAVEAALAWFGSHDRGHGFGNGRLARNLFEGAVARHAERLTDVVEPADQQLTVLEVHDIATVPVGGTT
ncbi:MAG: AAA family ATPase [Actinomycetota bacterium]|nr:AAA family ATPase [Actinomycetota bacterium]